MPAWRNGAAIVTLEVGPHESRDYPDGWRVELGDGRTKKLRGFRTREAAYAGYHAAVADQQRAGFVLAFDGEPVSAPTPARFRRARRARRARACGR
jgi:hypothetical protein